MRTSILRCAIVAAFILLIPATAMHVSDEWNWTFFDFIFAFILLFSAGLAFVCIAKQGSTIAYRTAAALAVASMFLLVWVNAAVGIVGDDDSMSLMYPGVVLIGLSTAFLLRTKPSGMAQALVLTASAMACAAAVALLVEPHAAPGPLPILGIHVFFCALFLISAFLFHRATPKPFREVL